MTAEAKLRRMERARVLRRRGVFLVPSLMTVGNILCGFSALILATHGRFLVSATLLMAAAVLDGLDGRIARLTGSSSAFGLQLDSIADTISFGVAPAYIMYLWSGATLGRAGWAAAFLYLVCASARLARFNIQHTVSDNRYFTGLPTPPAALMTMSLVLWHPDRILDRQTAGLVATMLFAIALLMVSTIRYRSFKDIGRDRDRTQRQVVAIAVILAAIAIEPQGALLVLSAAYVLSGPLTFVLTKGGREDGGAAARHAGAAPEAGGQHG